MHVRTLNSDIMIRHVPASVIYPNPPKKTAVRTGEGPSQPQSFLKRTECVLHGLCVHSRFEIGDKGPSIIKHVILYRARQRMIQDLLLNAIFVAHLWSDQAQERT